MVSPLVALRAKRPWQGIEQNQRRGRGRLWSVRIEPAEAGGGTDADRAEREARMPEPQAIGDGRGARHGSCGPSGQRRGPADQPPDLAPLKRKVISAEAW